MRCARRQQLLRNQVRTGEFLEKRFWFPSSRRFHSWRKATLHKTGAGDGNRTHIYSLEGCHSTTELHPQTSEVRDDVLIYQSGARPSIRGIVDRKVRIS